MMLANVELHLFFEIVQLRFFFFEYELVQGSCFAIVETVPIDEQYCTHETGARDLSRSINIVI